MSNSARHTSAAAARCGFSAISADFYSAITKISAVYLAVALLAQSDTIRDIESHVRIFSPSFNVMGIEVFIIAALLTSVMISFIYRGTPLGQLWTKACAVSLHRLSVLASSSKNADLRLSGAVARTKLSATVVCLKLHAAILTVFYRFRITSRPAITRTVFGRICTIGMYFIFRATNSAGKLYATVFTHTMYYTTFIVMCDVILRRWEAETGQTATLIVNDRELT